MKRQELLDAIGKVKPALADGKLIEFKGLLLFDGKKLVSYGDEISVSVPFETDFVAAISADEFSKLIQKTIETELDISLDNGQLLIKSGKMKAGFTLVEYNPEAVPDLGLSQVKRWFTFPKGFSDALKFCIFSASNDAAYGVLCNLKIEEERIISSDNYRITERNLSEKMFGTKTPLLIPRKIATFLSSFKLTKYAITDACAHYMDDTEVVFTHRLISEEYPQVEEHLKIEGSELELPKNLAGALGRAQAISSGEDESKVTISVGKKVIRIRGEAAGAWVEEPVDSSYKGEDLQFECSPEHLIQILDYSTMAIVGENALLFSGPDFRHSVCLINEG